MTPLTTSVVISGVQGILLMASAPLVIGIIRKVKARLQGRVGAPLLQGYRDIIKFSKKDCVVSNVTTWVFRVAPYMVFGATATVSFLLPSVTNLGIQGDIILIGFLLVLGTAFLVLTGLDAATTFGGMGSSREVMITAFSEPIFLTAIFALAQVSHSTSTTELVNGLLHLNQAWLNPAFILVLISFFLITLAENSRYPFDNPTTHLELTMVHEAMILENSGKNLAVLELASMLKLTIFLNLLATLVVPWGIAQDLNLTSVTTGLLVWLMKLGIGAVVIAVIESGIAKMRLLRIPAILGMGWVLAVLALFTQYFFLP